MRCIVKYDADHLPVPLLTLYIHDAPHRRMHRQILQEYRRALFMGGLEAGLILPIKDPIDLSVTFINPTSPDLDNILTALYIALDGKTLRGPSLLADDGLVQKVTMQKIFLNQPERPAMKVLRPRFQPMEV